ncbi:hypothetical protein NA57DRAFT_75807 [Rhizodiscina lignyota]|uniref:Phosphatidylglycerol/phosphatidylinositol transfer protein n=1 Tax=Rhizodiscina lignyota TaxID=1504668 RepID=A0A9P4IHI1_9PEZI|nr:hypothetical protein NA57DRAFT_75807 [Rhizodiscina lignyota]
MKFLTPLLALFVAYAYAGFGVNFGGSQVHLTEDYKVPGENPLFFCDDPKDNTLEIDKVDLDPNPPAAGQKLQITATGDLKEKIEEGAKIHLQVKYGLITLIKQDADLCDQASNINLECPIDEGKLTLSKDVNLPNEIPPGKYSVIADVTTKDGKKITCLQASIQFSRH